MVDLEELKTQAKALLESGKYKYLIAYRRGASGHKAIPAMFYHAEDADNMVWDPSCVHNLALYLVDERRCRIREEDPDTRPIGIVVKACDSRAVNILLQERFIKREQVHIIGVCCENSGVVDEKKLTKKLNGKKIVDLAYDENSDIVVSTDDGILDSPSHDILAQRCLECRDRYPVIFDTVLGDNIKQPSIEPYASVTAIESKSVEERWQFWAGHLDRCIRCYACRSVCPMCFCDECVVDSINIVVKRDTTAAEKAQKIKWIQKSPLASENFFYHMLRAIHLAGRCVDCAECERVCPVDIPLRLLNKKIEKDVVGLFQYEAGLDAALPALISSYKDDDPQGFIR